MNNKQSIEILNSLIVINNDRIEGYNTAWNESKDYDLKSIFSQFIQTSEKCNKELQDEVKHLGGLPDESTRTTGKFFRVWMDVKVALSSNDRKTILNSCEYGENVASSTYASALANHQHQLTVEQQKMLNIQYALIKADGNKIHNLKISLKIV